MLKINTGHLFVDNVIDKIIGAFDAVVWTDAAAEQALATQDGFDELAASPASPLAGTDKTHRGGVGHDRDAVKWMWFK